MKKLLFTLLAMIPVLGFAQQAPQQAGRTAQSFQNTNQKSSVKTEAAPVTVVLTEEQQHAVWLKDNADYKAMSKTQLTTVVEQYESKLARAAGSDEKQLANLRREIKWMKEILSAK